MLERLEASGRAVATFEHRAPDPITGEVIRQRGTLALEPPDRARLDVAGTGESVTIRSDGGEWLQPALRQLLRLGPARAASARRWWSLLLPGAAERFTERAIGKRRYLVVAGDGAETDSAWVALGPDALPATIEFRSPDGDLVAVRFTGWKFGPPRGRGAFVIVPPAGTEVVDLP